METSCQPARTPAGALEPWSALIAIRHADPAGVLVNDDAANEEGNEKARADGDHQIRAMRRDTPSGSRVPHDRIDVRDERHECQQPCSQDDRGPDDVRPLDWAHK